jgi:hypothetical protein
MDYSANPLFCARKEQYRHRINGVSDFVHRSDSNELEDKNTTFRKLDLLGPLEGANLNHWTTHVRRTETRLSEWELQEKKNAIKCF